MSLSEYELRVLQQINDRKAQQVAISPRRIIPEPIKEGAGSLRRRIGALPGVSKAGESVGNAYAHAAGGAGKAVARLSSASLSEDRLLRAYQRRGVAISSLEEIHNLDLRQVEREVKPKRMDLVYASLAAAEGALAGAVITGGQVLTAGGTVAGAGVGGAPGIGTIAGAMAVDAGVVLAAAQRVASHTGMYYGYDPNDPAEKVFALSVVNLGSALTAGGKVAAYQELSTLTQMLARRAPWEQLNKHVLPRIAQQFAGRFGGRVTQRKLGQLVPVVGIGVGAAMNFALIDSVAEAAYWTYRERFLRDKCGDAPEWDVPPALAVGDVESQGEAEVQIDLLSIIEDAVLEGVDPEVEEAEGPTGGADDEQDHDTDSRQA